MLDLQAKTNKEIWQAKNYFMKAQNKLNCQFGGFGKQIKSSQGIIIIVVSDDKWTCEIESANNSYINYILKGGHYICVEMRRTMNCKTISGQFRSEIFLKVKKDLQASAIVIFYMYIILNVLGKLLLQRLDYASYYYHFYQYLDILIMSQLELLKQIIIIHVIYKQSFKLKRKLKINRMLIFILQFYCEFKNSMFCCNDHKLVMYKLMEIQTDYRTQWLIGIIVLYINYRNQKI